MATELLVAMIVLAVFGGYVFTSLLLLRYPTLLHEKKKLKLKCRHISHRGGAGEHLENTMTAFKHATDDLQTDMLEIDCHITADGQVVVSHDNILTRSTGHDIKISDTFYKDLPLLKPALMLDFHRGHEVCGEDRRIPLLEELFQAFPKTPINIDIKFDSNELIRKVSELIVKYDRECITAWGNRSDVITRKCYNENPNVPLFFSMQRVFVVLGLFYTGLLPFMPLKESCYEVLMPSLLLKTDMFGPKMRVVARIVDCLMMNRMFLAHLQRRGLFTCLWVLNEEDDFERAFSYGVDGVMTDFPTKLRDFLDCHPQYRK